ncbi:Protein of unknown function [Pyronema omphalodes CBS 100304]|uniref:Uncharacterized protein n=1 Tax=Pyronema omphalodes (strain CBS 100304) TaxID=1076935 RepID=U4LUB3_PYROM|nr:Protein of unknown function [Pyronema omphalodes CBS 100304]
MQLSSRCKQGVTALFCRFGTTARRIIMAKIWRSDVPIWVLRCWASRCSAIIITVQLSSSRP